MIPASRICTALVPGSVPQPEGERKPNSPPRGIVKSPKSGPAGNGEVSFRLFDGGKVFVYQIDGAERERDRQRES
jgi:hypothetical protein